MSATVAIIFDDFSTINIIAKILTIFLVILTLKSTYKNFFEYASTFTVFFVITLVFVGAIYSLNVMFSNNESFLSLTVAGGAIIAFSSIRSFLKVVLRKTNEKRFHFRVEIILESGVLDCVGYYDSGNKLYDSKGNPVVIICKQIVDILGLKKCGEIAVNTIAGIKLLELIELEFKVYLSDDSHKVFSGHGAISDRLKQKNCDIILHSDML
jgi:hypothetical protein